ncbi:hypothetical protein [Actinomadura gamaensis]|uniref:Uncharacterized protein n=1 Tax=Actinomadura gamaensis TaxID=1763541 RepID=A0ABV9U479_9ACTN
MRARRRIAAAIAAQRARMSECFSSGNIEWLTEMLQRFSAHLATV